MLLGVIVRSKTKRQPHHRQKAKQEVPTVTEPHAKLIGFKRHYSASEELLEPPTNTKKSRMQLEVGIDVTPPLSGNEDDDSSPYEPATEWSSYQQPSSSTLTRSSDLGGVLIHTETESEDSEGAIDGEFKKKGEEESLQSVQMSFYGQHRPLESQSLKAVTQSDPDPVSISKSVALNATLNIPSSVGIQSILSRMSNDKLLKELASVMTSLGQGQADDGTGKNNTQNPSDSGTESSANTTTQPHTTSTTAADDDDSMDVSSTQQAAPVIGGIQQPVSGMPPANPPLSDVPQGNLIQQPQQSYFSQPQFAANQQEFPPHPEPPVQQQQHQYDQAPPNQTQWAQHKNDHRYGDGMTNYNHPPHQGGQLYTHPPPLPSQMQQQHPANQQASQQQLPYLGGNGAAYQQQAPIPPSQDYSTPHHYDGRYDHHYNRTDHDYYDSRPYDDRYFESRDYGHGQKPPRGGRRPPYERYRGHDQRGRPRR